MLKVGTPIANPLRKALYACFRAITCLVHPDMRRQLVLVGGAASVAYFSELKTENVNFAAPLSVINLIWEAVCDGALNFNVESVDKISFDAPQDSPHLTRDDSSSRAQHDFPGCARQDSFVSTLVSSDR